SSAEYPAFHDAYLKAWNRATATEDAEELRPFIATDYHGWAGGDARNIEPFSTSEAWEGFTQAARALKGASVHASNRTYARRGDREAIVFYELGYVLEGTLLARAALLESWRRDVDGSWKLHRDVTEHSVDGLHQEPGAPTPGTPTPPG
ncbi:MAG: hypothetical protein L0J68_08710, partial [Micrococcaceae bacterium]|nr:hypothetical protein [Micrococcaceae bacterium]